MPYGYGWVSSYSQTQQSVCLGMCLAAICPMTWKLARPGTRQTIMCLVTWQLIRLDMRRTVLWKALPFLFQGIQFQLPKALNSIYLSIYLIYFRSLTWSSESHFPNNFGGRSHCFYITDRSDNLQQLSTADQPPHMSIFDFLSSIKIFTPPHLSISFI